MERGGEAVDDKEELTKRREVVKGMSRHLRTGVMRRGDEGERRETKDEMWSSSPSTRTMREIWAAAAPVGE